jgi:hypothetical protein
MRGRKAGIKLLVRREDASYGGFGSLEKSVEQGPSLIPTGRSECIVIRFVRKGRR